MEIPNRALIMLEILGIVVAAILWACGVVPWWATPIIALIAPIAAVLVLILLFYVAWAASGSH